jgi:hypothetical protein
VAVGCGCLRGGQQTLLLLLLLLLVLCDSPGTLASAAFEQVRLVLAAAGAHGTRAGLWEEGHGLVALSCHVLKGSYSWISSRA